MVGVVCNANVVWVVTLVKVETEVGTVVDWVICADVEGNPAVLAVLAVDVIWALLLCVVITGGFDVVDELTDKTGVVLLLLAPSVAGKELEVELV